MLFSGNMKFLGVHDVANFVTGTIAFLRSISLEAVGLGVHLAAGAHDILLQAEYLLTSIPPSVPWSAPHRVKSSARSNQPKDAQQGIHQVIVQPFGELAFLFLVACNNFNIFFPRNS